MNIDRELNKLLNNLNEFGKVEEFQEKGFDDRKEFHIKITTGFDPNAKNTFECLKKIIDVLDDEFPYVKYCKTGKDMYHLILKS